jgi:ParB family chromosome partitioning protein
MEEHHMGNGKAAVAATTDRASVMKGEFTVPLSSLLLASEAPPEIREKLQVRKSDDSAGIEELEASLRHVGLVYPLIIDTQYGANYTTAGNRRLKCLRKIMLVDGENGDNVLIRVVDTKDFGADELEVAMAVNITLPPHPMDRYDILAAQVRAGLTREQIKERNAIGLKYVDRILALAELAPEIREAYRNDYIDDKTAQAFTLGKPAEQLKLFKRLDKEGRLNEHNVKDHFVAKQRDSGSLVEFVGIAEYEAAGGHVNRDLFGTDHTVDDLKLLQRMYREKMSSVCDSLVADGWAFAMTTADAGDQRHYYSTMNPAKKQEPTTEEAETLERLTAIASSGGEFDDETPEQIEAMDKHERLSQEIKMRGYTPEQRAKSGCFVSLLASGHVKIEPGKVKPEERQKVVAQERARERKEAQPDKGKGGKSEAKPEARISNKLIERLAAQLRDAAKAVIVREPNVAIAAIIAGCASYDDTCDIRGRSADISAARSAFTDGKKHPDFSSVFTSQLKATAEQRNMTLAQIAAAALNFHTFDAAAPPLSDKGVAALCNALNPKAMNAAILDAFDAKDYFESVSSEMLKRAISEAGYSEDQAKTAQKTKGDLAKFAIANVPKTSWLPVQLRLASYAGPKAAAVKPASKKKPADKPKKSAKKKATKKKK